jgi:uncharacterized protein DUF5996
MDRRARIPSEVWPPLPLGEWQDTLTTLHRWLQMAGKTRLALAPMENHWWHVAQYVKKRKSPAKPSRERASARRGAVAPVVTYYAGPSYAKRMKATTTELYTSHVPMLSQPKAVAAVIMDAAAKAQDASVAGRH